MVTFLYKITNTVNSKAYIGVSKDPYRRFREHQSQHSNCTKLKRAIGKYGIEVFTLEVLCKGSIEYISNLEELAIEAFDSVKLGYNILFGHHSKSLSLPDSVKAKISSSLKSFYSTNVAAHKGRKLDKAYNDHPVYVFGFWYPSVRFCSEVYGKHARWVLDRDSSEQKWIPPSRAKRSDSQSVLPIYVGGFWFPSAYVASEALKLTLTVVMSRVKRGNVEQSSTAAKDCKLGNNNPMFGITGAANKKSKMVKIEGVVYHGISEAVRQTGYTKSQIEKRIRKSWYPDFEYYTESEQLIKLKRE